MELFTRLDGIIGRADGIICHFRWHHSPELMGLFTRIDGIIGDNVRIIDCFDGINDYIDEIIDRFMDNYRC